ncbi:hypothetical protein E2P81_ATG04094 [Venturia nashicola]|uniref:Uncharacterized protein n=1 Tax=Venturia nashicola TaxID=86259 RepID=A0A4Z1PCH6_9PEZI|nr:hypothetical protein E6O75_ATG04194 [Venturia nashicola]TLD37282.1 hypothetical protein E2P81_ATG04094 [Venturia nashicola]
MALTTAVSDFIKSIFELFSSFFQTLFALFQTILTTAYNFFTSVLQLGADSMKGVFDIFGGVANFLLSNVLLIGLIAAGSYGYSTYQKRQHSVTVQGKKLN